MNRKHMSVGGMIQAMTMITLLAWAAQALLSPRAQGQTAPDQTAPGDTVPGGTRLGLFASDAASSAAATGGAGEQFVPDTTRSGGAATLELRGEASVPGSEVKLRQICRWADCDRAILAPMADLTVARFAGATPFQSVSLEELRHTLSDAGANLGQIRFAGATACTVGRSDVKYDESAALQNWIDAKEGRAPAKAPLELPAVLASLPSTTAALPLAPAPTPVPTPDRSGAAVPAGSALAAGADAGVRTLREMIVADASVRLKVAPDALQINFNPTDEKLLNLCEPQFKFFLTARRVYGLGDVEWEVLVITDAGNKKFPIAATARAWQKQVALVRPVAFHQTIQAEDVTEKRVLSDRMSDDPLLSTAQCVGQEAARELKPGTVLTAPMISPAMLCKPGQLVTVTLSSGSIRVKTVARAMEAGTFGQCVKVKPEGSKEAYDVVLTGPQEGSMSPVSSR